MRILDPLEWTQAQVDWWHEMPRELRVWIKIAFILYIVLFAMVEMT
jgi:hypothetical protein